MGIDDTNGGNEEVLSSTETVVEGANESTATESGTVIDHSSAGGFSSKFAQARERAFSDTETEVTDESDETATKKTSDAKVPEEEAETDEEEVTEEEEKTDEEDAKEADKKTPEQTEEEKKVSKRGEKFNQVVAERDTLQTQNAELQERLEKFEQNLEQFGGLDAVETAVEVANTLSDPTKIKDFVQIISKLPHRAGIQKEIFNTSLSVEANRIYGVNKVLVDDFGLQTNLSQERMERSFEFIVQKYNENPEEFDAFLERELELANTPENELKKAKAEIERLKNPDAAKTADTQTQEVEPENEFLMRIQKTHDEFEDARFDKISAEVAADYGFNISKDDPPKYREAKEKVLTAIKFAVGVEMRISKAHEGLLGYWIENQTDNSFYTNAVKNYDKALRTRTQNWMKTFSQFFNAKPQKKTVEKDPALENLTDPTKARNDLPTKQAQKTESKGFRSAFQDAKRSATS